MKVLMPAHPCSNPGFPKLPGKMAGGLETAFETMVKTLCNQGHEVTLFTSLNYEIQDPRVKQVEGGFLSKAEGGITRWKEWTLGWMAIADEYDRVVLNDSLLYMSQETVDKLREVSPKVRSVYHLYDDQIDGSFLAKQVQVLNEIQRHGGKVYAVSPTVKGYLKSKYPDGKLKNNPYFCELLSTDICDLNFLPFQVGVCEPYETSLESNGDFVFLGRGVKEKNLGLAIEAFLRSNAEGTLQVLTSRPNAKNSDDYFDKVRSKYEGLRNVEWRIEIPRSEVLEVLAKSSVLVFPSKRESFGLVPFEGSSFGMNLIYHDVRAGCYRDSDVHCGRCTVADFAKAISSVQKPSVKQKEERRNWMAQTFSLEKYEEQLQNMVE